MGYDDFEIMGMSALDPTPDEEAWEAYLDFAHPILGGDDALGLAAPDVGELESIVGTSIPWEIGLFLVLGVPAGAGWWKWADDAPAQWTAWQASLRSTVGAMVDGGRWSPAWGEQPDDAGELADAIDVGLAAAPTLLPVFEDCVVPLGVAEGCESDMANPILRVTEAGVEQVGVDLAEWLHQRFDVPLPVWPATPTRRFTTWSDLHSA